VAAPTENDEQSLCAKCTSNALFAKWIEENGSEGKCDFDKSHGRSNAVVTVEAFAEEVDRYFRENYQRGEEYMYGRPDSDNASYETYGEAYQDILGNDLECDEDVFNVVVASLPDCSHRDIAQGDEPFYDDCAHSELIADAEKRSRVDEAEYWYENRFSFQWDDFCKVVQFERRFFKTKELLDRLFGKQKEYHEGAVRPIYELKAGQTIFRARILDDDFNDERLRKNPAAELSAPPKGRARAGRQDERRIYSGILWRLRRRYARSVRVILPWRCRQWSRLDNHCQALRRNLPRCAGTRHGFRDVLPHLRCGGLKSRNSFVRPKETWLRESRTMNVCEFSKMTSQSKLAYRVELPTTWKMLRLPKATAGFHRQLIVFVQKSPS
jgi:hypothetical protein